MKKSIRESDYIFQLDEFSSLMKKEDITVKVAKNGYVFFADDETLGNNLLGFINPNTSNQKLHIKVPMSTVATLDEFENTKELVDFIISEYSHNKRKFESKKSARKSFKESNFPNKIYEGRKVDVFIVYYEERNGETEGFEAYGVQQLKDSLKWLRSDKMDVVKITVYKRGKNFNNDHNDVTEYYFWKESKKSARKSIKESKSSSILDDEFYELIEQGYIYDEDENGMNMSYGEYVAVSDDLWETLENELKNYRDFPSAYDAYNEIMDNTSDDAKMFMGVSEDDYFYFEINEDENTYSFSGEVPTVLEKLFKKFLKETDFERV